MTKHASSSTEQRQAEAEILAALQRDLNVSLDDACPIPGVQLDGFADATEPVLVEVWARQGKAKGSQPAKIAKDALKLLYIERRLARPCRKIFAVACDQAISCANGAAWMADALREFGIELIVVEIAPETRERLLAAQKRQRR